MDRSSIHSFSTAVVLQAASVVDVIAPPDSDPIKLIINIEPQGRRSENYLIKLFNILKDQRLQISEKTGIMSSEYEMDVTPDLESEVFNLGDSIGMSLLQSTFEEGVEKGISQGSEEKAIEIAKNMLKENLSIDIISKCSGLPIEQVEKLAESL